MFQPLHSSPQSIVLLVEDSEHDYEIFFREVKKVNIDCDIHHCETGEEVLDYLNNQGEYQDLAKFRKPSLILLDLNLPGTDGRQVLKTIKSDSLLKLIPIIIFSSSSNHKDIEFCYEQGVNAYVIKPMNIPLFQECVNVLLLHWLKFNVSYLT